MFEMLVEKNMAALNKCTYQAIITTDPHTYNTLKNEYQLNGQASDEDLAAAAMLEKELSERRSRYRRDVAELVELVLSGEDAGAAVAQGRAAAAELLQRDAQAMREQVEKLGIKMVELLDVVEKGSAEEAEKAERKLDDHIPAIDRLMKYLDANITQRRELGRCRG